MDKKKMIKVLKRENPNLSDIQVAQIYNLLVKLATIEFEFYKENNL